MIKNTFKSGNPESLKAQSWQLQSSWTNGHIVLQVLLFTVFCCKWSAKKHFVLKILQETWEMFSYKNNTK